MLVETFFENQSARLGFAGPLVVTTYGGAGGSGSLDSLSQLEAMEDKLVATHGRISTITVIDHASLKPDDEVRKRSIELSLKFEKYVHGSAIVIRARGLGAVIVRTFFSGFFMLSRSTMPTRIFGTIDDGLQWLNQMPGENPITTLAITANDIETFIQR